ncbi:hypothetical protein BCL69_100834 [Nitrosomonas communis]|uniref:Rap1a immunity protein domain-containing protein n=2 Tax=Nitrosomonadaceae TaxID=206379 RepID=A0A0F7KGN4_9PROT|nr:hypothetical protein AAW31_09515 [Nitrosomonas communis]TYP91606.1 hypothetical protein BCL69_100834 [Nitrosomonas communis]
MHLTICQKCFIAIIMAGCLTTQSQAATKDNFLARNAQDIIELCTASPADPLYKEAIHFCHGYLVGVYQYQQDFYSNPGLSPLVCPPDPKPSRNQAIANYVEWMKAHPEYLKERAVDTVMKYLIEKFPCVG